MLLMHFLHKRINVATKFSQVCRPRGCSKCLPQHRLTVDITIDQQRHSEIIIFTVLGCHFSLNSTMLLI